MYTKLFSYFLLIVLCCNCTQSSKNAKHFNFSKNMNNVHNKIKEIEIEDVLISLESMLYTMDQYLIIIDTKAIDNVIHLFDKNDFSYVTSTGERGPGPKEFANPGGIAVNEADRIFYVTDHGKLLIYCFELDSVLTNPKYFPKETIKMDITRFPSDYLYINDTLSIGRFIMPIGNSDFSPSAAKWNMRTGEITLMNKYDHPAVEKKRVSFAASIEHGIFVESYNFHDLISISDLDGNLISYTYGSKWNDIRTNRFSFFSKTAICKDKIVAIYAGGNNNRVVNKEGRINYISNFAIFDIHGNYLQTLETGYKILRFCYDDEKNRIIMIMDDMLQFAYLDLDGIV